MDKDNFKGVWAGAVLLLRRWSFKYIYAPDECMSRNGRTLRAQAWIVRKGQSWLHFDRYKTGTEDFLRSPDGELRMWLVHMIAKQTVAMPGPGNFQGG